MVAQVCLGVGVEGGRGQADWVGDGWREGAREQRGKEMKKEGREAKPSNATMCLQFTALKCKLGEINCACAIYAHASQFCDLCVETKFWAKWNSFEIETGSGDTFCEMLHTKCSVQAQSYLVAKTESTKPSNIEQDAVTSLKEHKIIALIWYTPSVLWYKTKVRNFFFLT